MILADAEFGNRRLGSRGHVQAFTDLRADRVILIGRDRDRGEDADDRHDNHQFDQGEALLGLAHDVLRVHGALSLDGFGVDGTKCAARFSMSNLFANQSKRLFFMYY